MKITERKRGTVAFGATFVVICCIAAACAAAVSPSRQDTHTKLYGFTQ